MLGILAHKTQDLEAKEVFNQSQLILSEIKDDLQKQIMFLAREEPQYKQ